MSKSEKIFLKSGKVKWVYIIGVFFFFAITIAILLSKDVLFHRFFNSPTLIFIASVVSWILAGCFTVAAFICACSGRGYYELTKQRINYKGPKGRIQWEIKLVEISDCRVIKSPLMPIRNCCKLALILKEPSEGRMKEEMGLFPGLEANIWETEIQKGIKRVSKQV